MFADKPIRCLGSKSDPRHLIGSAKSINQHIAPRGFQFGQHCLIAGYSFRKTGNPLIQGRLCQIWLAICFKIQQKYSFNFNKFIHIQQKYSFNFNKFIHIQQKYSFNFNKFIHIQQKYSFNFNKFIHIQQKYSFNFNKNIHSTSTNLFIFNKNIHSTSTKIFIQLQQKVHSRNPVVLFGDSVSLFPLG